MEERENDNFDQVQLTKIRTQLFHARSVLHVLKDQIILRDREIKELKNERDSLKVSISNLNLVAEVFGEKTDLRKRISR